jgi:hypothetical protein
MDDISQLNDEYNIDFKLDTRTLPEEGRGGSDYHSFVRYGFDSIAFLKGHGIHIGIVKMTPLKTWIYRI